ncbi:hypothetical protein ACMXYV_11505 [Neptuniibacter sp. SY11_33]|uniref:hypothetical protein n=1 Tax=Neptuniibacter sp. SY11_33 TaxID=3398215 RepID=UPI0039F5EECB
MEEYAVNVAKWLQDQVAKDEANDPKLRPMKDRINEITTQLRDAKGDDIAPLLKRQGQAIMELMDHIALKS